MRLTAFIVALATATACGVVEGSLGEHETLGLRDRPPPPDAGPARDATGVADLIASG